MPLKLVAPRKGKSPNWTIRGTYLKVPVDRSAGTDRRSVAARIMRELEGKIERGEFPEKPKIETDRSFISAALAYLKARRPRRKYAKYIGRLIQYFRDTPLDDIDQQAIDKAALELYPDVTPCTRNTCVYTPMGSILHHAGREIIIRRPKGSKGRTVTDYLDPQDAFGIIGEAYKIRAAFGLFLEVLLFTGCRIGEVLAIRRREHIRLSEGRMWIATSKNGDPREIVLRADLCEKLTAYVGNDLDGRLFPFHQGGHLKHMLMRAKLAALGIPCPSRRPKGWTQPPNRLSFVNFHTFCHTWGTWMRRYGGLDLQGLVATRRWRSLKSAQRYAHVVARDEWQKVESLPSPTVENSWKREAM